MPFNYLILPLIGGFLFLANFNPTKFRFARQSKTRFMLYTAFAGVLFLAFGRILEMLVGLCFPEITAWMDSQFARFDHSVATILSLLIGAIAWKPLNYLCTWENAVHSYIEKHGDELEVMMFTATINMDLLMFTIEDGKVYVGFVERMPSNPNTQDPYFRIVPVLSGFRRENKTVEFTTFYNVALNRLREKEPSVDVTLELFLKILPINRVIAASYFAPDAFDAFQQGQSIDPETGPRVS